MNAPYRVRPVAHPVQARVRPPGSKSLTNRALVCAALGSGKSRLTGVLDSEDTRVMVKAWQQLGIDVLVDWQHQTADIRGCGGHLAESVRLANLTIDVANSGTTIRFMAAVLAALSGSYRLEGTPRMHQRPIGDLASAVRALGGQMSTAGDQGTPPVSIQSAGLAGGNVTIDASASSQFVSALMLAAPLARQRTTIRIAGHRVSRPYIAMTHRVMHRFGIDINIHPDQDQLTIDPQIYQAADFEIEPDASAASYFFAAAAIVGGSVTVEGLSRDSLQGDVRFVECLERMGCTVHWREHEIQVVGQARRGTEFDLGDISDTAQTLAAVALFADSPTTIRGIAHNRLKETDRIGNLATELRRVGATVVELDDGLAITPGPLRGATLETYDDHRMAMSLALIGLRVPGIEIANPTCVGKTYPNFFIDLERVIGQT
ncbi:MAG TPA: 3-phosphoshikimate 1-carboxyvinyltransferase [Pirellulaceae bacterium]|nr:3-phosphoshikimate 1-carboxyvinyltransferase [Pirellulaceae bacterium]